MFRTNKRYPTPEPNSYIAGKSKADLAWADSGIDDEHATVRLNESSGEVSIVVNAVE